MSNNREEDRSSEEEDEYFPPISPGCFNCGGPHDHRVCQEPRNVFCFLCDWPGVTKATCRRPSCRAAYRTSERPRQAVPSPHQIQDAHPDIQPATVPSAEEEQHVGRPDQGQQELAAVTGPPVPAGEIIETEPTVEFVPLPGPSRLPSERPLTLRFPVASSSEDSATRELREILAQFFSLKGYSLPTETVVQVTATLEPPVEPVSPLEQVQDLIDLHPDSSDEVDPGFDIRNEVERFEKRGRFE